MATTYLKLFEVIGSYWLLLVVNTIQGSTKTSQSPNLPISQSPNLLNKVLEKEEEEILLTFIVDIYRYIFIYI